MPAAIAYPTDPNSAEAHDYETLANNELRDRRARITKNWEYYRGKFPLPLESDGTSVDDNLIINLIELIVDKGTSGLTGAGQGIRQDQIAEIEFDIVDEPGEVGFVGTVKRTAQKILGSKKRSPEQVFLDETWAANIKSLWLYEMIQSASLGGHVFVKVLPEGAILNSERPRLILINPKLVTAFWQEDDVDAVLWYRVEWSADAVGSRAFRQDFVHNVQDDVWAVVEYERGVTNGQWRRTSLIDPWPHDYPPLIAWKNLPLAHEFYGKDDMGQLGRLNKGLNFIMSSIARILKYHAGPRTIGTGIQNEGVIETDINRFWTTPNEGARIYNLEMQSDLSASLATVQFLRRSIFDSARELDPASVQDKLGDLTNFALRVLYGDNLAKNGMRRVMQTIGLKQVNAAILELGGFDYENLEVSTVWPDPLPSDPLQMAQALAIDTQHGLSQVTYLEERGFSPEVEAQRRVLDSEPRREEEQRSDINPETSETNSRGRRPNPLT